MMAIFSLIAGFIIVVLMALFFRNERIPIYIKIFLYIMFIVDILLFTSCITPVRDSNMDLYRYYERINLIRDWGVGDYVATYGSSIELVFTMIMVFIAKVGPNVLAPIISCAICFMVFGYIYFNYQSFLKLNKRSLSVGAVLSLGIFFLWLPYFQIIDNLRSPIASAIIALAIYLQIFHVNQGKFTIILYILASLTHISVFPLAIFMLMYKYLEKVLFKYRKLFLVAPIAYGLVGSALSNSSLNILSALGTKLQGYTDSSYNVASLFNEVIIAKILALFFFIILFEIISKKISRYEIKNDLKLFRFLLIFMYFCLGSAMFPTIMGRYTYILAFFSTQMITYIYNCIGNRRNLLLINTMLGVFVVGMQAYAILKMSRLEIGGLELDSFYESVRNLTGIDF